MLLVVRPSSTFAPLFRLWFGLVDHSMTWCPFHNGSFLSSWRFSAWFGRSSRRSHLRQKFGHGSSHLLRRSFALAALPGTQAGLHQWTRHHQVIMHDGDDLTPAFKLCWGTQPGLCPQQGLLVKAIAMLVRVAPPIAQSHLWHAVIRTGHPTETNSRAGREGRSVARCRRTRMTVTSRCRALGRCNPVHHVISTGWPFASLPCHLPSASP